MKGSGDAPGLLEGEARTDLMILSRRLMQRFGGPEGLADKLYLEFEKADPGSPNRLKLGLAVVSLHERFAADDGDLPSDEAELEALARSLGPGPNGGSR